MSPTPTIQTSVIHAGEETFVTAFVPGHDLLSVGNTHPNFKRIVALAAQELQEPGTVDAEEFVTLFDPEAAVKRGFERLTERVTVEDGQVYFDGDPVNGTLQEQILDFMEAGEDFEALVNFYEKLMTNPLGNVQEGLFTWIRGQKGGDAGYLSGRSDVGENAGENAGAFSITPEGDIIGYKSMKSRTPDWREDVGDTVYVPSRVSNQEDRVNDAVVPTGKYIEQVPGDVVEMPRSKVLNAPTQACGDGLHIGTWAYARDFQGDTVMLVKFSPRDIVSLPDSNSTWKLRVNRYTVIGPVEKPLDAPLYIADNNDAQNRVDEATNGEAADIFV